MFWFCDLFIFKRGVFCRKPYGEASQKQSPHHATHDISKVFGAPTKGLLMKVDHNVDNEL